LSFINLKICIDCGYRYLLLSLLGKGGFSEVWKALDMAELKEVALKVKYILSLIE
jgi:tousled-like kinase